MTKRNSALALSVGILATASIPAFADPGFGYEVDYVLNAYGREVTQTSLASPPAFGVQVDAVAGTFSRPIVAQTEPARVAEAASNATFASQEMGMAFGLRAFGHQSGA
jgi:hypothetical protein